MKRINVENGKYTFVERGGYRLDILRGGEPWAEDIKASKAIQAMMAELDAARVVLAAARKLDEVTQAHHLPAAASKLSEALKLHDDLVDDREAPSTWARIRGEDPDEVNGTR